LTVGGSLRRRVTDPTGGGLLPESPVMSGTPPPRRTAVMEVFSNSSDGEGLPEIKKSESDR
jgi:hypothetical protein